MKLRPLAIPFVTALLLALAAGPACGGDDASPPERYFRQLEETRAELSQRFAAVQDEFEMSLTSEATDAEITQAARDYYGGNLSILKDMISRLEDIKPPADIPDAEQTHQEFVKALKDFAAVFEDLSTRAASAESASELEGLLAAADRDEFDAVAGRFGQACLALQDIADANGISVDLNCGG